MGVRIDPQLNAIVRQDADIAATDSPARVLVIRTEEELMVAREVRRVVGRQWTCLDASACM
jgi:acetate kinase